MGEGTAALAQLSGAPFVAISHSCARGWIADGQWDRRRRLWTLATPPVGALLMLLQVEGVAVKVKLVAPPLYVLTSQTLHKDKGLRVLGDAIEAMAASESTLWPL